MSTRRKTRFLLDECVQISDSLLRNFLGFVNATELVPPGTEDDLLFQEAKKRNLIVITRDIRFTINTIISGNKIVFCNDDNPVLIEPRVREIDPRSNIFRFRSWLTYFLQVNEEVILP